MTKYCTLSVHFTERPRWRVCTTAPQVLRDGGERRYSIEKLVPHPHEDVAFGFFTAK
jgi:hypothetical protein